MFQLRTHWHDYQKYKFLELSSFVSSGKFMKLKTSVGRKTLKVTNIMTFALISLYEKIKPLKILQNDI